MVLTGQVNKDEETCSHDQHIVEAFTISQLIKRLLKNPITIVGKKSARTFESFHKFKRGFFNYILYK